MPGQCAENIHIARPDDAVIPAVSARIQADAGHQSAAFRTADLIYGREKLQCPKKKLLGTRQ